MTDGSRFALSLARARTLPPGVEIRTQSPAAMPRVPAASGWISTCGSGAERRSLARLRCWDSQNHSGLAQVRMSGKRSARSGRERGLVGGSSKAGRGGYPADRNASEYSPVLLVGVWNTPEVAYLRGQVVNGTRTPAGLARNCSRVMPLGAS